MPHRDPQTGQFVSDDMMSGFDDIEVATFEAGIGIEASNLSGGTGFQGGDSDSFEGLEIVDYDDIVDRNEELHLLRASHALTGYVNSTESEDGALAAAVEISAAPSRQTQVITGTSSIGTGNDVGFADSNDTIDLVGRPLFVSAHAPFSDTSTGVGGGGAEGDDSYDSSMFPAEFGRFHPRDELFVNGQLKAWNIDDAGVHIQVRGQHVYGVLE